MLQRRQQLLQLIRFVAVGLITNAVGVGVLYLARLQAFAWWLAMGIAYATSMIVNYTLQRRFTFQSAVPHRTSVRRYVVVQGIGLALSSGLMQLFAGTLQISPPIAWLACLVVVTVLSYGAQKWWVFVDAKHDLSHSLPTRTPRGLDP